MLRKPGGISKAFTSHYRLARAVEERLVDELTICFEIPNGEGERLATSQFPGIILLDDG